MIRFADSCSWCTADAAGGYGASLKYSPQKAPLPNANIGVGRYGGQAYYFNTASSQIVYPRVISGLGSQVFDSRNILCVNGRQGETIIWRYAQAGLTIGCATLGLDGRIRIYRGGTGADSGLGTAVLLYTSSAVLAINTWYSLDMAWSFPASGNGSMSLYINDALDTGNPGHPSVPAVVWGGQPDRFAMCWGQNVSTGILTSDIVVSDNTPGLNTGRLGPCQVALYLPIGDAIPPGWMRFTLGTATSDAGVVNELPGHSEEGPAPDGDYSYITTGSAGKVDMYNLGYRSGATVVPGLNCYASILGLAWNACAQEPASTAQNLVVIPNPSNGMQYTLGSPVIAPAYSVGQVISETAPDTGQRWTDGYAGGAWWGIESTNGAPRVTQMMLEKITTTRGVPYNCGNLSSYTYASQG